MQHKFKEIGRVKLTDNQELVVSLVDGERLDIRIWISGSRYSGPTKRGVRFYLFDERWDGFWELMKKVNESYREIVHSL